MHPHKFSPRGDSPIFARCIFFFAVLKFISAFDSFLFKRVKELLTDCVDVFSFTLVA